MPKSPRASPSSANQKSPANDSNSRLSDIALRKKKNADAQAAFRARRNNYIVTLETTVTTLEDIVIQLQESYRDLRAELQDALLKNHRLQQQCRERDRFWRDILENRRLGPPPDADDISSPSFSPLHAQPSTVAPQMTSQLGPYNFEGITYRSPDETPTSQSAYGNPHEFSATGNPLSFHESEVVGDNSHCLGQRVDKPLASGCSPFTTHVWTLFVKPLTGFSQMSYVARFPNDDSKLNLGNFEATSFPFNGDRFPESRSLSPTSTTPSTSSSTSILPLPYQYAFSDPTLAQDTFRRSSHNEMTLQGGAPNIPFVPGTDTVRYHVGSRQSISMPDHMVLPVARSGSASESQQDHGISDGDCASYSNSRLRSRRNIKLWSSQSLLSVPQNKSCTITVIKAQAFGNTRRIRTKTKKSTETATRIAYDVLEARGIDLGNRRRRNDLDGPDRH